MIPRLRQRRKENDFVFSALHHRALQLFGNLLCLFDHQSMTHGIHTAARCFCRQTHGKFQGIFSEVSAQINRVIVDLSCTVKIFCTVQHPLNRHFSPRCTKMQHHTVRRSGNEAGSADFQRSSHQAVHSVTKRGRQTIPPPSSFFNFYLILNTRRSLHFLLF
jgi:hypothetical protein